MTTDLGTRSTTRTSWLTLLPFLAAALAAAVIGGLSAAAVPQEYASLEQPAFAPPSWVFGPVWTVLYVMIGIAGWLFWRAGGWNRVTTLWVVQLLLNAAWTPLFFGSGQRGLALVDIVLLDVVVLAVIALGWRVSRPGALLMVPYVAWTLFASALNAAIWAMN